MRNARILESGSLYNAEIVIDDDKIRSIVRSYRGPYDEEIDLKGSIVIPGILDPFIDLDNIEELYELPKAGITQAIIALKEESRKAFKRIIRDSPIDIGLRTSNPYVPPREVFGYIANERTMKLVWEFYGPSYVAIRGIGDYREKLRLAKKYSHRSFLINPPIISRDASCIVIYGESALRGSPSVTRNTRRVISSWRRGYAIAFYDKSISAPLMLTIILKGLASRKLFDRLAESLRLLGFDYGLLPGTRANIVALRRKTREKHGFKLYFDTYATIVGGELVYLEDSFIAKPKIALINGRRG